jgi:hypothetical protein
MGRGAWQCARDIASLSSINPFLLGVRIYPGAGEAHQVTL